MQHTISVLVENKFGALARIASLFSGRGFNIKSLAVSPTDDEYYSKMTIVTSGDEDVLEQIDKQLNKLVNVKKVIDMTSDTHVSRELMLIKVSSENDKRNEIMQIANIFKAKIINVEHASLIIELTGPSAKLDAFVELMHKFSIIEMARTGRVAMLRATSIEE